MSLENVFQHSSELRAEICKDLSEKQTQRAMIWMNLQDTLNRGDFAAMDAFFHDDFSYGNPSRPDLGSYASWKTSPMELYKRFPPSAYRTKAVAGANDDEVWVYCHHTGKHTGGPYMGKPPEGKEISVEWFSSVSFKGDKIVRIFSIADVLSMLIQIDVVDPAVLPVDPYK
jgi:predicted ester cyclase|tara:strand:- start:6901 stop:7413 length:513 start_codon:yes stop_codon:yes gene_type:complete